MQLDDEGHIVWWGLAPAMAEYRITHPELVAMHSHEWFIDKLGAEMQKKLDLGYGVVITPDGWNSYQGKRDVEAT